jgi:ubiquitin-conjugating enzyme (huntingtin interacting protein 2)
LVVHAASVTYSVISQSQDIVIPSDYPHRPSKLKFITKVYHPNISSVSGAISLNILNEDWCPALTLRTILISLQALLNSPYPNDPLDADVAKHYMTSKQSFDETARYWTRIYAGDPAVKTEVEEPPIDEIAIAGLQEAYVNQFEELGFERSKVVRPISGQNKR